jgi:CRISPR system Cascade subunit CasD
MSIRVLLLRFDAPMISFGAPMVDQNGVTQRMPALSMLTGLFGNALGYRHADAGHLTTLQERLRFAARTDRAGASLVDYQIVDLGMPWMDWKTNAWTTRGQLMRRGGGSSDGLHIRYRHFRADSVHTVAVTLESPAASPAIEDLAAALKAPARPLFLGRKTCLPASPLFLRITEAKDLLDALTREARHPRADNGPLPAWWDEGADESVIASVAHDVPTTDERDWRNQVHTGRRLLREGLIDPPAGDPRG